MQTGERRNPLDGIRTGNRNRVEAQLHPTSPAVASKLTTCQSWCPPVSPVLEQARFPPAAARGTELSIVHGNERYYYVYIYYCITIAPAFEGSIAAEFSTRFVFRSFNNKTKKNEIFMFSLNVLLRKMVERERNGLGSGLSASIRFWVHVVARLCFLFLSLVPRVVEDD